MPLQFEPDNYYGPFRKIVGRGFHQSKYARPGHGSVALTLECGHTVYLKKSKEPAIRTRCGYCR